ncbi:DNRLRE domain-containing protein [Herbidospora cretacea]|uniref:DNRLRE domain-containing protein n=1 Tax=Herbidospora cretacea TaxID=28444 RepID=UPI0004C446AA|nr:DNRLRE domain-containing protein [Herbidospora cretacea]
MREDGAWRDIDTTLVRENGVIRPKSIKGEFTLSAGGDLAFAEARTDQGKAEVRATAKLPKPQLSGDTATYPSAYGDGVDLVVTATPTGLRQKLVIRKRPDGQLNLRIPVELPDGMRYGSDAAGKLALLAEKSDKPVVPIPAAMVLDAVAAEQPGQGRIGTAPVTAEKSGDDVALLLAPDAGFLADPTVTYPVSMALASDVWTGTGVAGDTFVNSSTYPNGASNDVNYQRIIAGKSNSGSVTWRAYITFPIKGTPLMGGVVENADLRLWNFRANTCDWEIDSGIVARRITGSWSVSSLTWGNQPSVTTDGQEGNKGAYSDDCSRGEGELYHSIETMVQEWMDGAPDHGVQLSAVSEADRTNWRWYRSSEYGGYEDPTSPQGPALTVNYIPAREEIITIWGRSPGVNSAAQIGAAIEGAVPLQDPPAIPREQMHAAALEGDGFTETLAENMTVPDGLTPEEIDEFLGGHAPTDRHRH